MSYLCKCKDKDGNFVEIFVKVATDSGRHYVACQECGYFRWEDDICDEYEKDGFVVSDSEESSK